MTAGASADTMLRAIPSAACGSIGGRVPAGTPVTFAQVSWAVLTHDSTWAESSARRRPTAAIDATTATPITIRIRTNPPVVITRAAHPGTLRASSHSCARRATIAASAEKVASANRPPASAIPTVTTVTAASMIAGPRSSRTAEARGVSGARAARDIGGPRGRGSGPAGAAEPRGGGIGGAVHRARSYAVRRISNEGPAPRPSAGVP